MLQFAKHNIRPWEMPTLLYDNYIEFRFLFQQPGVS